MTERGVERMVLCAVRQWWCVVQVTGFGYACVRVGTHTIVGASITDHLPLFLPLLLPLLFFFLRYPFDDADANLLYRFRVLFE